MHAKLSYDVNKKVVQVVEYNKVDAVSLSDIGVFQNPIFICIYGPDEEVHVKKAFAWRPVRPGTVVCLQDHEIKAKIISQAEYETFEVFQNDQNA